MSNYIVKLGRIKQKLQERSIITAQFSQLNHYQNSTIEKLFTVNIFYSL